MINRSLTRLTIIQYLPLPTLSYRYKLIVDSSDIITTQVVSVDLDLYNGWISAKIYHPAGMQGDILLNEIETLSTKNCIISIIFVNGEGIDIGKIIKTVKMISHSMPLDYSSTNYVEHTLKFEIQDGV